MICVYIYRPEHKIGLQKRWFVGWLCLCGLVGPIGEEFWAPSSKLEEV